MGNKTHHLKGLLVLVLLSMPTITIGQSTDTNTITYKSPSKDFVDITIQSHKELPRFGDLYYHRGVTPPTNANAYKMLVEMKYLTATYADIDKNKITKGGANTNDLKFSNSIFSQQHFLQIVSKLGTEEFLKQHFCDDSNPRIPCTFIDANGMRKHIGRWGNSRNEFQQMRSYKAVVTNHLEELQNWSKTFFKDDHETVYFVSRSMIYDKYDFKNKGYWVGGMGSGDFMIRNFQFNAYTENEKKLTSEKMFLAIPAEKAKTLNLLNRAPIFTVFKVRVLPNVTNSTNVRFTFELEEKIIEIYKDIALTQKIGEIDINNTIFKY